jgi:phosphate starvation-inducible protein PhoH
MSKEKQKNQKEIDSMVEDFNRNRTPRKTGITKTEWEKVKTIITLTPKQLDLYKGVRNNTLTICQGPAGTAKTFVACYAALGLLADKKIERIILIMEREAKLIVTARSWQKDSFGLFDFESKEVQKTQFVIEKSCKLFLT